jgi:hypothetical protein
MRSEPSEPQRTALRLNYIELQLQAGCQLRPAAFVIFYQAVDLTAYNYFQDVKELYRA